MGSSTTSDHEDSTARRTSDDHKLLYVTALGGLIAVAFVGVILHLKYLVEVSVLLAAFDLVLMGSGGTTRLRPVEKRFRDGRIRRHSGASTDDVSEPSTPVVSHKPGVGADDSAPTRWRLIRGRRDEADLSSGSGDPSHVAQSAATSATSVRTDASVATTRSVAEVLEAVEEPPASTVRKKRVRKAVQVEESHGDVVSDTREGSEGGASDESPMGEVLHGTVAEETAPLTVERSDVHGDGDVASLASTPSKATEGGLEGGTDDFGELSVTSTGRSRFSASTRESSASPAPQDESTDLSGTGVAGLRGESIEKARRRHGEFTELADDVRIEVLELLGRGRRQRAILLVHERTGAGMDRSVLIADSLDHESQRSLA